MRIAHALTPWGAILVAAAAPWAWAQTSPPAPHPAAPPSADWLNPAADSLPLLHPPLPASGAVEQSSTPWPQANTAVAAFPRGHADVLRWEAAQPSRAAASSGAHSGNANPAQCPMGMDHPMSMSHGTHRDMHQGMHSGMAQPPASEPGPSAAPAHDHGGQH